MDTTSVPRYSAAPVLEGDQVVDIRVSINGKTWHLWGKNGADRERNLARSVPPGSLPVLMGAGLGHCLEALAFRGPVAVVDREESIRAITGTPVADHKNVTLIDAQDAPTALAALRGWQQKHGGEPLHPVRFSLYLRLAPSHYGLIAKTLEADQKTDFWARAQYPKFQSSKPRILFLRADYFLSHEIETALTKMKSPFRSLPVEMGGPAGNDYVEALLNTILEFKPDFALTINHFGLDRDGKITELLSKLNLPLASWFVDNPHLILYRYQNLDAPGVVLFTYDAGNLGEMRAAGFRHVHYLPLATDPERFKPGAGTPHPHWTADVSFVGNSMTTSVKKALKTALPSPILRMQYTTIASAFGESEETSAEAFINSNYPELAEEIAGAGSIEQQLALESLITWESTRQYRVECVRELLGFSPLIVGDEAWKRQLPANGTWSYLPSINYYQDLPAFYQCSHVNFNCTSLQMKGAVNQRAFDVPACGGFLLTDHRQQIECLFDPEEEVAIYNDVNEIPERIEYYLSNIPARNNIVEKARKRILAEHTYTQRLATLCKSMREHFS